MREPVSLDWLTGRLVAALQWQMSRSQWGLTSVSREAGPSVPIAGRRVWSIFLDLNAARSTGFGPSPITYSEIEAWSRAKREPVRPWELDIIRTLDRAFLKASGEGGQKQEQPVRKMSPALFDAVFG
jgi:hypothetical protein